jgi:hypothetical protein
MANSDDQAGSNRPNVVFILVDNVGWGDIGCYGGVVPTPRIDALAGQGCGSRTTTSRPSAPRPGRPF